MSELFENAFETEAIVLTDEEGTPLFGIFSGGTLPHVAVPDAPDHSIFYHTSGSVYTLKGENNVINGGIADHWEGEHQEEEIHELLFFNSNGSPDNIRLTENVGTHGVPFYNSDGSQDDLHTVTA